MEAWLFTIALFRAHSDEYGKYEVTSGSGAKTHLNETRLTFEIATYSVNIIATRHANLRFEACQEQGDMILVPT